MVYVDDTKIFITRGNTAMINVELTQDGEPYTLAEGDRLIISVKRKYPFNNIVLDKVSTTGQFLFIVDDTIDLAFGAYDYDITFYGIDGTVDTFITGIFEIGEEAHIDGFTR